VIDWNLDPLYLRAWADRARLRKATVAAARVMGYAHGDSLIVEGEGLVRILGCAQAAFLAHDLSLDHDGGDGGGLRILDAYYPVEPIGWQPRCPRTGEPLTSLWIDGPSYMDDGAMAPVPEWWATVLSWDDLNAMEPPGLNEVTP